MSVTAEVIRSCSACSVVGIGGTSLYPSYNPTGSNHMARDLATWGSVATKEHHPDQHALSSDVAVPCLRKPRTILLQEGCQQFSIVEASRTLQFRNGVWNKTESLQQKFRFEERRSKLVEIPAGC
ncbi:hypothetical protein AVEN_75731-1 [Araneus ventricosus]|uniref:Uncharacterized protein n=1 Tax=Araneus ventricosus TaxID=182803 RepID=A0A4Y2JYU4_ARAVE|nr:hypothetical protein AVEN_75731-1 [Araneus ventricosus]